VPTAARLRRGRPPQEAAEARSGCGSASKKGDGARFRTPFAQFQLMSGNEPRPLFCSPPCLPISRLLVLGRNMRLDLFDDPLDALQEIAVRLDFWVGRCRLQQ